MPGGDKTGPTGGGPMTGRGAGFCAGFGVPGYANPGVQFNNSYGRGGAFRRGGGGFGRGGGYGRGGGFGRGFGWRNNAAGVNQQRFAPEPRVTPAASYYAPPEVDDDPRHELAYLRVQAKRARESIKEMEARIEELKSQQEG